MKRARSSSLATDKGRSRHKSKRNLPVFSGQRILRTLLSLGRTVAFAATYTFSASFDACIRSLTGNERTCRGSSIRFPYGCFSRLVLTVLSDVQGLKDGQAELLLKPSLTLESHSTDYLHPDVFHSNIHRPVSLVQTLSYV